MCTKLQMINHIYKFIFKRKYCHVLVAFFMSTTIAFAQLSEQSSSRPEKVQLSGVVLDADNRQAIPYATVKVNNGIEGSVTDSTGFFNLKVSHGDTLSFTEVGYKAGSFVVPESMDGETYSMIKLLYKDTVEIGRAHV